MRFGSRLLLGRGTRCRGTPLSFGLKFRGDPFGRLLFRHRTLGGGTLGRETFGGGALSRRALSERALRFRALLRGQPFGVGTLRSGALRRETFGGGAELFLRSLLLGRATRVDGALHRFALLCSQAFFLGASLLRHAPLFLGTPFVIGAALCCRELLRGATFRGSALLLNTTLGRRALGRGPLGGRALRRGALIDRPLLFLSTTLLCGEPLLDRALHRRVLHGGALFLIGTALLSDPSFLRGALGRGAILRGSPLIELARFRCGSPRGCGALRGGALFGCALLRRAPLRSCALRCLTLARRASLFFYATLLGGVALLRRARLGRALSGDPLLVSTSRLFGGAPFLLDASRLVRAPFFCGVKFGRNTFLFRASRFLGKTRFLGEARFFCGSRRGHAFVFGGTRGGDAFVFRCAFPGDARLLGVPRISGRVHRGEDLFIFEAREDLVILDLHDVFDPEPLFLCRLLSHRSLVQVGLDGHEPFRGRRPRLFDPRLGPRRGALDRSRGRSAVLIDELFEQTAERVGRSGAQI